VKQWSRMRSKMVKVLDNYYFKEMQGAELQKHIESVCEIRTDISNMHDVELLMAEQ
jgi:hypothetical protein